MVKWTCTIWNASVEWALANRRLLSCRLPEYLWWASILGYFDNIETWIAGNIRSNYSWFHGNAVIACTFKYKINPRGMLKSQHKTWLKQKMFLFDSWFPSFVCSTQGNRTQNDKPDKVYHFIFLFFKQPSRTVMHTKEMCSISEPGSWMEYVLFANPVHWGCIVKVALVGVQRIPIETKGNSSTKLVFSVKLLAN